MAERRMFTKKITDDDHFSSLSSSAQALYLHLSMSADDDGFCNQVSISMFKAHASVGDLEALLEKRYIYQFENGVIVIKHWRMANALRKDRYTPTTFKEELAMLALDENGSYTMNNGLAANRLPNGCQMVADRLPQVSVGKDSVGKVSLGECSVEEDTPTLYEQLTAKYGKDFVDERIGRASNYAGATIHTVAKWCEEDYKKPKKNKFTDIPKVDYSMDDLERKAMAKFEKDCKGA